MSARKSFISSAGKHSTYVLPHGRAICPVCGVDSDASLRNTFTLNHGQFTIQARNVY
jgi:hypothetical protein